MAHRTQHARSAFSRPLLVVGLALVTLIAPGCSLIALPFKLAGSLLSLVVNNLSKLAMLVIRVPVEEGAETESWLRDQGLEPLQDVRGSLLALSSSDPGMLKSGKGEELLRLFVERAEARGSAAELVVLRAEPEALLCLRDIDNADPSRKSLIFVVPLGPGEEQARERIRCVEALARAGVRIDDRTRGAARAGLSGSSHAAP